MKHTVRRTLLCLGAGVVAQRLLQLLAFVCIGRTLGVAGLGVYAQGLALAAILTVLGGAGVRNLIARAVARQPAAARALVVRAVRLRLGIGLALAAVTAGVAFGTADQPWFWLLCALHVVPAAFDLKNLVDAAGRTRGEVALESAAAAVQLGLIAIWAALDGRQLETLAAISLGCRCLYALGALLTIRSLRDERPAAPLSLRLGAVGIGQTCHELLAIGDVALVAWTCGDSAAGLYAVATRFATAALLPSAQLARLLLPHLLHAHHGGNAARTFVTALRATLWLTLPMVAGGLIVADSLCALSGQDFRAGADALRLLLLAGCCQHVGWQCSHALLAAGRDRAYAHGLAWPAGAQAGALALLAFAPGPVAAPQLTSLAAAIAVGAHACYLAAGLLSLRTGAAFARAAAAPLVAAAATAAAAALPAAWPNDGLRLGAQLALGAGAFAIVLWRFELRGRTGRVGDGLATASGFVD